MADQIRVGIVGASEYGGIQLVHLLHLHPNTEVVYIGDAQLAGKKVRDVFPHFGRQATLKIEEIDVALIAERCEVVFFALPHGGAFSMAPQLLEAGCKVLDLSADYRFFDLKTYQSWYSLERSDEAIASRAVYGLPEVYRSRIPGAQLVGCPACYATASLLAIAPLLRQGLASPETIIIDAKTGSSGGGKDLKPHFLMSEAGNSVAAYGVARHRHTPEIEQVCSDLLGHDMTVQFTPHLVPMVRGLLTTVYATLRDPGLVREDLITIYRAFFQNSPWIEVLPGGTYPQTKWALGTNRCFIGIEADPRTGRVILMSALDNLIKGQAGQAIQCLNLMMGWDEMLGLPQLCFYP